MKGSRSHTIAIVLAALLLFGLGWVLWEYWLSPLAADRQILEDWIRGLGPWGPVSIVVLEVLQVLFAPIPGQFVGLAAGYLYGVFWGTVLCLLGLALGTALAVWLGRRFGRPLVERIAGGRLIRRIDHYAQKRGALALLLVFLVPFLPDDLACFVAGLTALPLAELVALAVVGRLPGLIVSTLLGAQATELSWPQIAVLAAVSVALALLVARYQRVLERRMFAMVDRLVGEGDAPSDNSPGRPEPEPRLDA